MLSTKFYTTEAYFSKRFDDVGQSFKLKAKDKDEFEAWKKEFRIKLRDLIGLNTMQSCDLNPRKIESIQMDGYTREKYTIETEPGIIMPFYVLIPDGMKADERRPAVIAPHGHGSGGKMAVTGVSEGIAAMEATIKHYNYDYGISFVKAGFVVFCPDARGFGERREKYWQEEKNITGSSCEFLNYMAISLGQCVTGMWTWDLMRLLDYMQTRKEVNVDRIGCAGLSGGGLQTLWVSALDDRIKCVVISGYLYGYKQSILESMCCSCNYVPGLYELADIGDIGALILPRPVLIETGDKDSLNGKDGIDNVLPQVNKLLKAAALYGKKSFVSHDIFPGEHRWNGVKALPWLKKHLFD